MSSGDGGTVSSQDVQLVQDRIEQCLKLYMGRKEVINTLFVQDKIEPSITELVWQRLEEENQEFFKAYYLKLLVKEQIMEFNRLLKQQVELMHRLGPTGVTSMPLSNGSHISAIQQNPACHEIDNTVPAFKPEHMHKTVSASLPNTFRNPGFSVPSCMQEAVDMSACDRAIDVSSNMFAHTSNAGIMQTANNKMVKGDAAYVNGSPFDFGAHCNILGSHSAVGDAGSSFSSVESNSQPLNEAFLDANTASLEYLNQISQNFSLPELAYGFPNGADILEGYSNNDFVATEANNILVPDGRREQGDMHRFTNASRNLKYGGFGGS